MQNSLFFACFFITTGIEVPFAFDFDKAPSAPTTEEKADALIEEIGQRIEESLSTPSLGELVQQEMSAPASPAKEEKFRKFEDLQFGPNYHPTKK